ncbi:AAA family ATPase [Methanobacterium alkalithermotolerans]|uniref:AAA family ATPase n=1 Tax=Methanobacterium alkalithermotolerans TaxID=2731220 RepID=A0A8T8K3I5_9EURY|nr:ATPase domain-containing protein [Methanobacterium alkalithermotolerans]QUH22472.1 AAA family ATPase [Methanobacterium alkalithermotolerans]RJS49403.1 MAG: recombinase [Methanobacterium sp.]
MERIKTGIKGLDEIISGFPQGRTIILTGDAGSGKTIFALQFAKSSCLQNKKTAYITTEEDEGDLLRQTDSFKWDMKHLMDKGTLEFVELAGLRARVTEAEMNIGVEAMKGNFEKLIHDISPDREVVIIDSLGSHTAKLTPYEFRDRFDLLIYELKERNITALIILDSATSQEFNELALFAAYGAIKLMKKENPYTGRRERVMDIIKMRSTRTPIEFITYEIRSDGISLISESEDE